MPKLPETREEVARQGFTLPEAVQQELEALRARGELGDGAYNAQGCHICCEVESRDLVNKLLAAGLTNREIAETCEHINRRRRSNNDRRHIGPRNVWVHRRQHFNLDEPAKAAYRAIAERHAENANIDHINGVGTAVTPYALMHVAMAAGFANVMDGGEVKLSDALNAAKSLHQLTAADQDNKKMADILYTMDRILKAAEHFIDPSQYQDFVDMVAGKDVINAPIQALNEQVREEVRGFAPNSMSDEGEEL